MASVNGHFSSAGDMKAHLQSLLDSKEHQLQQAATFGQRVLAQRMELEERIRQLQEVEADKDEDDEIDMEAVDKYKELAETVLGWDNENAELSTAFNSSKRFTDSLELETSAHTSISEAPREEHERSRTSTSTSAAAQSRRAKNAAHRADDVEFAFEIGSGLLNEVRRLQSLLGERDKAIQDMKEEKDDLENTLESLRTALKQQEQSADKYKEENWNLEVSLQELRQSLSDSQSTAQRLESEHKRLTKQLANSNDTVEQYKNENATLQSSLEELTAKHETDVALARKHAAGLARDKSDLQQVVDKLKAEQDRAGRKFGRFGSPVTPSGLDSPGMEDGFLGTPANMNDDVFSNAASTNRRHGSVLGDSMDGELSPDQSPISKSPFLAPNHPTNEIEVLKQKLAHANRQITTLKGGLMRERMSKAKNSMVNETDEDDFEDIEQEAESISARPRASHRRPVRGRGRGRGHGRGGLTLTERMFAANSNGSVSDHDDISPVPPIHFQGADEDEMADVVLDEGEDDDPFKDDADAAVEVPSNRSSVVSVDGMDPAFANVLRQTPSTSSIPPNTSPLHQSLLRRSTRVGPIGRRRGGAAFQDGNRPPSLVGHPEDLAAALGSTSPLREDTLQLAPDVETAQFACQTEYFEDEKTILPTKDLVDAGIQSEPERLPSMLDMSMQTIVEEAPRVPATHEMSTATDPELSAPPPTHMYAAEKLAPVPQMHEMSVSTDPEAIPPPMPILVQTEVQTSPALLLDVDTQTTAIPAPIEMQTPTALRHDADAQTGTMQALDDDPFGRRSTLTQQDFSTWSDHISTPRQRLPSNSTVTRSGGSGRQFIRPASVAHEEEEESDVETETGVETDTDFSDYQDARQSIAMSTPASLSGGIFHDPRQSIAMSSSMSTSQDDFQSVMTMTDNEYASEDDDDEAESIKASQLSSANGSPTLPPAVYGTKSIEVNIVDEPAVPLPSPPPKPEVREISIQTDAWSPPAPPPPPPSVIYTPPKASAAVLTDPPPSPGHVLYKVGTPSSQQFTFIPPKPPSSLAPSAPPASTADVNREHPPISSPAPAAVPSPFANVFRENSNAFSSIRRHRTSTDSGRQSIESAMSSLYDDGPTPKNAVKPAPSVDKTRPPTMMLPPPPRAPPPPGSMPPPSFLPERRMQTLSAGTYDMPPARPSSPPPPELIQRATTPTFGSVLSVPRGTRQQGSSMPPMQAGLRQLPSTSSFRSAVNNAASYAQHPVSSFRAGRELSSTSLASDRSPRSSISSDRHSVFLNAPVQAPATPANRLADMTNRTMPVNPTDPTIIHSITQTMIGEYLYKYTRKAIGKGYGERRHKRFFWVHPYTKTLYWSSADPGSTNVTESSAKSAFIDGVRSVLDPNPMPPGLYQYSVVVSTPQREMKITAPTKERHDIWLNALKYLLSRPNVANIASPGNVPTGPVPDSPLSGEEFSDDGHGRNVPLTASPQSQRSSRSVRPDHPWNTTPRGKRSRSQLSVGGSIGKRSGTPAAEYLRWNGPDSPYSPSKSFVDVPAGDGDDLDFELHAGSEEDDGYEGLENVRACCDGRHTVGHSGKLHHHHHHHHNHDGQGQGHGQLDPNHVPESMRPVSPSAWSFRSRSGSTTSHDGGTGVFSWDGKLRFGSRRSAKAPINS